MNLTQLDTRRDFLKRAAVLPAALMIAREYSQGATDAAATGEGKMPRVPFGKHTLSRLVCGANPFNGGSHLSGFVNREMRAYYTPEQILKTLRRCQQVGINGWQSGSNNIELYQRFIAEGGQMHYLSLATKPDDIPPLVKAGCVGIAHHGEVTDQLFKAGHLDQVNELLKRVRDAGLRVGVSTHMPAVVDAIESKGWDLDFYMTCVYERHRTAEELKKLLGYVPIPVREVYLEEDPPRMFKVIRQTRRTCLAFKILAAGRLCENKASVEKAFRETFAGIKPTDAVLVGLYDRYSDQPAEDAAFTRRFGSSTPAT
ncbi:MAG: twin-arginine translocation signal domain-containing protein [Verrucomicrobia bacterium]|nr:twin-arginine translocation signal domain-containing protein [Verrucomicrobiota bacterium]